MSSEYKCHLPSFLAGVLLLLSLVPLATEAEPSACVGASSSTADHEAEIVGASSRERLVAFEEAKEAVENDAPDVSAKIDHARSLLAEGKGRSELEICVGIHFARTLVAWGARSRRETQEIGASNRSPALDVEAASLFQTAAKEAEELGLHRLRAFAQLDQAEIYKHAKRIEEALWLNHEGLLAAQAVNDPEALARLNAQRGELLVVEGKPGESMRHYELARSALERLRFVLDVGEFLDLARPILNPLADLLLAKAARQLDEDQALLREVQSLLEGLKTAELRDHFGDPCLAEQDQIDSSSISGAAILYPVLLADRVELLVGVEGRLHRVPPSAKSNDVLAAVRRFRLAVRDPTTQRYRLSAEQLYDGLIRPIEQFLKDGVQTLVFVPSVQLWQVPFGALRDRETDRFLIERIPVATTPSLKLTEPRPIDRQHVQTLVAGLTTASGRCRT